MHAAALTTDQIRSELERLIPPADAARAMLSALAAWGPAPPGGAEVHAFVDGPLRQALAKILTPERSTMLVGSLRGELGRISERPTPVHEINDRITGRLPLARNRPVPVLVIAKSSALSDRLQILARTERATITPYGNLPAIERAVSATPLVVIIDATDIPDLPAEVVVGALQRTPKHVQWIVWGSMRAHGREVSMLAELAERTAICLREEEGIGAMVDVILARRG